jgi:multidrug efflux pump subunit AcrB
VTGAAPPRDPRTLLLRNPHLLWLAIAVILVGGVSSVLSLPRLEDPRIVNRGPLIITPVPGAPAERVEALVTEPLENALDEIPEIKDIDSTSRRGISLIAVELDDAVTARTNQQLFAEIRDKVGGVAGTLPPEAGEPFVDDKREAAAFTLVLGVTWEAGGATPPQLGVMNRLAQDLADRLRNIPGTDLVRLYGAPEEEIVVEADAAELAELGLSAAGLASRIAAADAKRPAGVVRGARTDVLIEVEGELETVSRVERVPVARGPGGGVLTIGDVARVERAWRTPDESIALVEGRRSVLVAARIDPGVRIDAWAPRATRAVEAFEAERGGGITIDRVFEQEPYTTSRLSQLVANLAAGAGVILLCVFAIMGLRPAVIVATALPLVVSLVLVGWQVFGVGMHQMSIFGLIIALGLLIDNAIVMTDEVNVLRARGLSPTQAVAGAVRLLLLPLLASTVTTVLAFAPIMLLPGGAGDFVGSIGTSVILAIIGSFAIAMTITAALAGIFSRPPATGSRRSILLGGYTIPPLARRFERALAMVLRVPVAAIAIAFALPLAGFAIAPTLGNQFFPPVDRNMFEVRVWMPTGTSIDATRAEAEAVERTLRSVGGIGGVSWLVGGSFPTVFYNLVMDQDGASHYAHGTVTTDSAERTKAVLAPVQELLDERHPGAQVLVRKFQQGPPVVADIEYRVFGPSIAGTQRIGDALRARLQAHPDVIHTQATMPRGEPTLSFEADEDEARLAGLSLTEIAAQLESSLEGAAGGSVIEDLERLPVRVRTAADGRGDLDAIASTPLVTPGGDRWVSAAALGGLALRPELGGITRFDGARTNTIKAYVRAGALPIDIATGVLGAYEAEVGVPAGYRVGLGGAGEQDAEAKANLAKYLPVLVTVMVATLVLAFRSVLYACVLGGVALASVGLALLSTWAIDFPISFNTILGTLGLIGVALNDSIVVLASIKDDPDAARGDRAAVVRAVMGCLRHVIATTATTIGGFIPLLVFVGGEFWPSLAVVLVGGIAGATLVALVYIPAAHLLVLRLAGRRGQAGDPASAVGDGPPLALAR